MRRCVSSSVRGTLAAGVATLARRLGDEREQLPLDTLAGALPRLLQEIQA